jgi:hypothetical protein
LTAPPASSPHLLEHFVRLSLQPLNDNGVRSLVEELPPVLVAPVGALGVAQAGGQGVLGGQVVGTAFLRRDRFGHGISLVRWDISTGQCRLLGEDLVRKTPFSNFGPKTDSLSFSLAQPLNTFMFSFWQLLQLVVEERQQFVPPAVLRAYDHEFQQALKSLIGRTRDPVLRKKGSSAEFVG